MHAETLSWTQRDGWRPRSTSQIKPHLVLYFGVRERLADGVRYRELRTMFPDACLMGCTTGGQIHNDAIVDDEIGAVALRFDQTKLRAACEMVIGADASRRCGEAIGAKLMADDLAGVFVLSDGLNVNGSELVAGIIAKVGAKVSDTGGLAGDGSAFKETLVGIDSPPQSHAVAAIGFYGRAIRIGSGSAGGWDVFGPRRRITRSKGNVLFELDSEPALDLYERYLGEDEVKGLPGTALLFPLQVYDPARPDHRVVRTVLAVDRAAKSMTFAGDMPEGWAAQMMRGNFDRLAAGAADAAQQARHRVAQADNGVAILVSCIGRRLLMGQRTTEEVEAAAGALGSQLARLGFYSYGEISPHAASGICELHNQTMTVTTITEAAA
jgi:hypothetical protein